QARSERLNAGSASAARSESPAPTAKKRDEITPYAILHRAKKGDSGPCYLPRRGTESNASFQARFLPNCKRHTTRFETTLTGNVTQELELPNWTRRTVITEQGKPFLADYSIV